ncbi:MAG: hypothetical protein HC888_06110 [Candidatus Competibacteraceae bacterium]|nr:hypothetical protein [Candidatus Competibacteraceae bacterium]
MELNENVQAIEKETKAIDENVNDVKTKIPTETLPVVRPHLENIRESVAKIDQNAGELTALNEDLDHLKAQVGVATGLVDQMERIAKKHMDDKVQADAALTKALDRVKELEQAETTKTRAMLRWIIGLCVVAGGISGGLIFLGRMNAGIALGVIASGTLAFAVAVSQYLEWIAFGGIIVIGLSVAYILYQLFVRDKAISEVVHTNEIVKNKLPEDERKRLFGSKEEPGVIYTIQSPSTESIVQSVRQSFKSKWEATIQR